MKDITIYMGDIPLELPRLFCDCDLTTLNNKELASLKVLLTKIVKEIAEEEKHRLNNKG